VIDLTGKKGISGAVVKNLAMIAMIVDHLTQFIWAPFVMDKGYLPNIARGVYVVGTGIIGRMGMPLFSFLIAEGVFYTRNRRKYLLRIFLTAVLAFFPYIYLTGGIPLQFTCLNIMFAFSIAILAIMCMDRVEQLWLKIVIVIAACLLSEISKCEYASSVILLVTAAYYFRGNKIRQLCYSMAGFVLGTAIGAVIQDELWIMEAEAPALLAFIVIAFYNGERGKTLPKWVYYVFYPAHLVIIAIIRMIWL